MSEPELDSSLDITILPNERSGEVTYTIVPLLYCVVA